MAPGKKKGTVAKKPQLTGDVKIIFNSRKCEQPPKLRCPLDTYLIASPVLRTLHKISHKYKRLYCYPSQSTLVQLMQKYQKVRRSIRTLNRWLRDIEDAGMVRRVRRITKSDEFGFRFQSTIYTITRKGYEFLKRSGVNVWGELKKLLGVRKMKKEKTAAAAREDKNGVKLMTLREYQAGKG